MNRMQSILAPTRTSGPQPDCVAWLAATLDARVDAYDTGEGLTGLRELVRSGEPDLVVLSAPDPGVVEAVAAELQVPVLVSFDDCPAPPWECIVVPVPGPGGNHALAFAAELAAALDMHVIALHAADGHAEAVAMHYADAPHHEYAYRLDEFVTGALPHCSEAARCAVTESVLRDGEPAPQVRALAAERDADLIVLEASSPLVGPLAADAATPLLLVPRGRRAAFRLKVGELFG